MRFAVSLAAQPPTHSRLQVHGTRPTSPLTTPHKQATPELLYALALRGVPTRHGAAVFRLDSTVDSLRAHQALPGLDACLRVFALGNGAKVGPLVLAHVHFRPVGALDVLEVLDDRSRHVRIG